jgi:hypothetical protein
VRVLEPGRAGIVETGECALLQLDLARAYGIELGRAQAVQFVGHCLHFARSAVRQRPF